MPRRQFVADLQAAQADAPPGISSVRPGEDDGQIAFECNINGTAIEVTAQISDLGDYPTSHDYYLFCGTNAPAHVASAIENISGIQRQSIFEALRIISSKLSKSLTDDGGDVDMPDTQSDRHDSEEEVEADDWDGDSDVYTSDDDFTVGPIPAAPVTSASHSGSTVLRTTKSFRDRVRHDLRQCKEVGFKVGHIGHLMDGVNCYITVSVRVSKLGISDEALQAWQLQPDDYLILLIQYPNGYRTNEEFLAYDNLRLVPNLVMRVVTGKKYKPDLQAVIKAFSTIRDSDRASTAGIGQNVADKDETLADGAVRDTFISKSIAKLLQDRLVPILRYRTAGMSWTGAEDWYQHVAGAASSGMIDEIPPSEHFQPEPHNPMLPSIVQGDHFKSAKGTSSPPLSFPLLAMQFMLRHFVGCTDFCLNCHRKLSGDLNAIKPYVCDYPLCLFQYMSLGFGQSIEHEIVSQPYVVDLLISFCYSQSASMKLKDFPTGLGIMVAPLIKKDKTDKKDKKGLRGRTTSSAPAQEPISGPSFPRDELGFDPAKKEMIFFKKPEGGCPVRSGDWIMMQCYADKDNLEYELHVRVTDASFYPTVLLGEPMFVNSAVPDYIDSLKKKSKDVSTPSSTPSWIPAKIHRYDQELDNLIPDDKCAAICRLLDVLPSVKEMHEYISRNAAHNLAHWAERISPAALALLRWIIASNRACILQNEECQLGGARRGSINTFKQERVSGMTGYMQFRFAMGAPDKEQRFMNEVKTTAERLNLKYPTMFAWHGSPLSNWHSIIREGLHYRTEVHGRAFGHGVYHSQHALTSTGYSSRGYLRETASAGIWPNSILQIMSAIALNEIVNAPAEFVSSNPHYVVNQLDWIQTRYLFVQVAPPDGAITVGSVLANEQKPEIELEQDPVRRPRGMQDAEIMIPASAFRKRSANAVIEGDEEEKGKKGRSIDGMSTSPSKKLKSASGTAEATFQYDENGKPTNSDSDAMSDVTDEEDRNLLLDSSEPLDGESAEQSAHPNADATDSQSVFPKFEPGTLDFSKLPLMPTPQYATGQTTKRLLTELKQLSKVQESTPLSELGWYVDVEQIENVYQWIVELHSFHTFSPTHPLALDMQAAGVKSMVLEVRFGKDFPYTPPYIRVVRPRFRTLMAGGGGHIVSGGAMCMELLTNTGWSAICSMESVLMQVRMAIGGSEPVARLDLGYRFGNAEGSAYGTREAAEGYLRACRAHGWEVPEGFMEMAYMDTADAEAE